MTITLVWYKNARKSPWKLGVGIGKSPEDLDLILNLRTKQKLKHIWQFKSISSSQMNFQVKDIGVIFSSIEGKPK